MSTPKQEVVRILSEDKKKVSEQAVLGERFPYTLHRIIEAGINAIVEAKDTR